MPLMFSIGRDKPTDKVKKSRLWEITPRGSKLIEEYDGPSTPKIQCLAALHQLGMPATADEVANTAHVNKGTADFNLEQLRRMECARLSKSGGATGV